MANLAYLQLTRNCNQKCRFCSNPPSGWKDLTLAEAKRIIDTYIKKKYDGLILTGGEPTIYPCLLPLLEYAKKKKFPTRMITNAQSTSDKNFLSNLVKAGLDHIHVSIYSHIPERQNFLTQNKKSFENIRKTLDNLSVITGVQVDANITLNKYNADHLHNLVEFIVSNYSFVNHFIFNNLDPSSERVRKNLDTIPELIDFELELNLSLQFLAKHKKTFRVERVPLCYLSGFEYCSTETRKIVKEEIRPLLFLDEKGFLVEKNFYHEKFLECRICFLNNICAGFYKIDKQHKLNESSPVFISKNDIIRRIIASDRS